VDAAYNHTVFGAQLTGGSTSVWSEWDRLLQAGAAARVMLIQAAAEIWRVNPKSCRAEKGVVIHEGSTRRLAFGKLVERAASMKPPKNVPLKSPKDFKILGRPGSAWTPQKKPMAGPSLELTSGFRGCKRHWLPGPGVWGKGKEFQCREGQNHSRGKRGRFNRIRGCSGRRKFLGGQPGKGSLGSYLGRGPRASSRRPDCANSIRSWPKAPGGRYETGSITRGDHGKGGKAAAGGI